MNTCPCCSNSLLRHIRKHEVYHFCRSCWQEMPVFSLLERNLYPKDIVCVSLHKQKVATKSTEFTDMQTLPRMYRMKNFECEIQSEMVKSF